MGEETNAGNPSFKGKKLSENMLAWPAWILQDFTKCKDTVPVAASVEHFSRVWTRKMTKLF